MNEFKIGNKVFEVFISEDKTLVEVYEKEKPDTTGFIFGDKKEVVLFINNFSDIVSKEFEL